MITRIIPSTQEALPAIGLGTWKTFDVSTHSNTEPLRQVLKTLHHAGGTLIDSSPMYGNAEEIVGELSEATSIADNFFYATKVWIEGKKEGIQQMQDSMHKMRRDSIDLMQIHNLVDWKTHLQTLREWKEEGKVKYIGITHYTDNMHDELARIISSEKIDFVQFNYSITARNAEKKLLPVAAEHGVATLINRPFGEGALFKFVLGKKLPAWAEDYNISTWAQFMLKFIVSHPAVTCVIPATSKPTHMQVNCLAGNEPLPDENVREKMAEAIKSI